MFVDQLCLEDALQRLYGTAGHLLKVWFTLKHMGLTEDSHPLEIDTGNSTPSLQKLFSCGAPDGRFYIPFAHTPRYLTMKHDAARSIIQTTIQRWATSGSVVTCDPTTFLDISLSDDNKLQVSTGRRYPLGLGIGESGFALHENERVAIPIIAFSAWYGRQTAIPEDADPATFLVKNMLRELHISSVEKLLIFVEDNIGVHSRSTPLTDNLIYAICEPYIGGTKKPGAGAQYENFSAHARRVQSMVSNLEMPGWMRSSPGEDVRELIASGTKAILVFGPPRTGKSRLVDAVAVRDDCTRCTIQIHDGWGYDHLIEGLKVDADGNWTWTDGPLKKAIEDGKHFIVLEEVNRTTISQALGEVFSLIEDAYRGEANGIVLRSGKKFWIPENVVFLLTMNTLDKSTEDVDDALFGRVAAVEFPPRPEDLIEMLSANGVRESLREKISLLYAEIVSVYPLGHGYFAGLRDTADNAVVIRHYKSRIRPVLFNFFGNLRRLELAKIDNYVDELFGSK